MALSLFPINRNMELLPDQRRARKKMYRDRKMNIFKKGEELSILCGTDVLVILFQPTDKGTTSQPAAETWPKDPTEVERIIRRYKAKLAASTHASSPSTSVPEIKDKSTSTPPSSSPSPSPSRSVPEKRKYMNLDLSLSGSYDSQTKKLKEDEGKKKLHAWDDDENINSQEAGMEMQLKYPTIWDHAERENLYDDGELMIGYDDHQAKLASLEAKQKAITKRIASLEATHA
ncbi:uncharacterized protein LOC112199245 [Rosa chinensis]|uniref:uncharacterized protein LOC112199245 n=1 Tax=Rosa chinensis TaxID=74649 RepID=UPI001AD92393|nr:uncharacterized protein LOC112199245 [Rosa chinensis]